MNHPAITITGKSITNEGIQFVPADGCPDFTGTVPEVVMWNDDDAVTVTVTVDTVYVVAEKATTTSACISSVTRTTTAYRCPVRVVSCRPDFSVFDSTDDTYDPADDVPNFGMFSDEGNLAVECAVLAAIDADNLTTARDVAATVTGHPEVNDTVVRDYIHAALMTAGLIRD